MIQTQLSRQDVEDVRLMVLRYMQRHTQSVPGISRIVHISAASLYDFLERRTDSAAVVVALVSYLPLGIVYYKPRLEFSEPPRDNTE